MTDQMRMAESVRDIALAAKAAAQKLATTSGVERNAALDAMARALREHTGKIVAENEADMDAARRANTSESLLDRLMLITLCHGNPAKQLVVFRQREHRVAAIFVISTSRQNPVSQKASAFSKLDHGIPLYSPRI